ncbi:YwmB family TATA-box binding protein [Dehalobacterium formicoaceticum]|uniref:YwmB family TATA-box binding protein n=1 Tax=Dehalobacterium formicoaceticum TaxID=51515 RepID=UPI0031F63227
MKFKRGIFFTFLIGIIAISSFINYYYNSAKPAAKISYPSMEGSFQQSQATFAETKLQGWAKINEKYAAQEELSAFGGQIQGILGIKNPITKEEISEDRFRSLKIKGQIEKNFEAEVVFQSLKDTKNQEETYLIISMVDRRGTGNLKEMEESIHTSFRLFDQQPKINQLLIGFYGGKLSPKSCQNRINEIFSALDGKIIGEVEEENYLSKTGYVPNFEETLKVDQQDLNLQAAMFYDELADRTYLYLGSPLIYADY